MLLEDTARTCSRTAANYTDDTVAYYLDSADQLITMLNLIAMELCAACHKRYLSPPFIELDVVWRYLWCFSTKGVVKSLTIPVSPHDINSSAVAAVVLTIDCPQCGPSIFDVDTPSACRCEWLDRMVSYCRCARRIGHGR